MHPDCIVHDVEQGSDEWHKLRCGLLTASAIKSIVTPTLNLANNDKTRQHVYEIAAQRISGYTEPTYYNDAMLRGHIDEVTARELYSDRIAPVEELGMITRDIGGVTIGYSPDGVGLFGDFGIEVKSRIQKYQIETITSNEVPSEYVLQIQTGLLVTGWDYLDFISYSGGLPMWVIRCEPIEEYQEAITEAAVEFERQVCAKVEEYHERLSSVDVIETERELPENTEVYFD